MAERRAVRALADLIDADFHRIQFTPGLQPADLTGSVLHPDSGVARDALMSWCEAAHLDLHVRHQSGAHA